MGLFSQSICCCVLSSTNPEELGLKDGCDVGVSLRKWFDSPLGKVFLSLLMEEVHVDGNLKGSCRNEFEEH